MLIEFDFNDEALFQKYKVFIQYATREIEGIVRDPDIRSHLRWSDDDFEALRLDFRVSKPGLLETGLVRIFDFRVLVEGEAQEDIAQETLKTIRLMVS